MASNLDLRPSSIAGQWYSADPKSLAASVDRYMNSANLPEIEGKIIGIMSPHAGHRYSGPVAGYAFAAIRDLTPEVVAVLSPMHYWTEYPLLTTAYHAYTTPLGPLPLDRDGMDVLNACLQSELGFGLTPIKNDPEHSLEIELPFLQRALKNKFHLMPIMVRDVSPRLTRALGKCLAQVLQERNALLVASTDLSHFYPQEVAEALDKAMLRQVEALDPEGVLRIEEEGKGFACGRGALAAVLWAARELGADTARVLQHATSGDVTGDYTQVVGYAAAVFTQKARPLQ
jgi:AmmeMemoRadiSam system protein B